MLRSLGQSSQLLGSASRSGLPLGFRLHEGPLGARLASSSLGPGPLAKGREHENIDVIVKVTESKDGTQQEPVNSPKAVRVLEGAGAAFVLHAAAVEASLLAWSLTTGVVREGTAAAALAVSPG